MTDPKEAQTIIKREITSSKLSIDSIKSKKEMENSKKMKKRIILKKNSRKEKVRKNTITEKTKKHKKNKFIGLINLRNYWIYKINAIRYLNLLDCLSIILFHKIY